MKRVLPVILLVLLADQALKVWVKLTFYYDTAHPLFGPGVDWAYLHFIENEGMAFGLRIGGGVGKLLLTLFRIAAVIGIGWYLRVLVRRRASAGLLTSLALIFAGAMGNIIDSTFYGLLFSESTHFDKAVLLPPEGGYAPLFHGSVVDMFYFPLLEGRFPAWLPIWGGEHFLFFRPVFNLADASISLGVAFLILFQRREFARSGHAAGTVEAVEQATPPDAVGRDVEEAHQPPRADNAGTHANGKGASDGRPPGSIVDPDQRT